MNIVLFPDRITGWNHKQPPEEYQPGQTAEKLSETRERMKDQKGPDPPLLSRIRQETTRVCDSVEARKQAFFHDSWTITQKTRKTPTEREYEGLQSIDSGTGIPDPYRPAWLSAFVRIAWWPLFLYPGIRFLRRKPMNVLQQERNFPPMDFQEGYSPSVPCHSRRGRNGDEYFFWSTRWTGQLRQRHYKKSQLLERTGYERWEFTKEP